MGPPCSSFSKLYVHYTLARGTWSRSRECPRGSGKFPKEVLGNLLADLCVDIALKASSLGVHWSIEQPASSLVFLLPSFLKLQRSVDVYDVYFHQCQWGLRAIFSDTEEKLPHAFHKKPTRLWTSSGALEKMSRRCLAAPKNMSMFLCRAP